MSNHRRPLPHTPLTTVRTRTSVRSLLMTYNTSSVLHFIRNQYVLTRFGAAFLDRYPAVAVAAGLALLAGTSGADLPKT